MSAYGEQRGNVSARIPFQDSGVWESQGCSFCSVTWNGKTGWTKMSRFPPGCHGVHWQLADIFHIFHIFLASCLYSFQARILSTPRPTGFCETFRLSHLPRSEPPIIISPFEASTALQLIMGFSFNWSRYNGPAPCPFNEITGSWLRSGERENSF